MTVSHLAQLRQLQDENAKLKRMYADLALMHHESPRVLRRLNTLRGLSHEQVEQILTRGA